MKQALLIADRDAELCDVYRRFLTDRGYEVETSSDGLDCLRKLRQVTPAVLVLDLELLWGGGDGVLAWLREESLSARDARRAHGHGWLSTGYGRIQRSACRGLPAQALRADRSAGECPLCRRKKGTKGAVEPESCSSQLKPPGGFPHETATRQAC